MKRSRRVKSGFVRMPDEKLLRLADVVYRNMVDNSFFPEPYLSIEELDHVKSKFMKYLAHSRASRSLYDIAMKNQVRKDLKRVLKGMAHYVNLKADGSMIILLSSGFEITQYRKRIPSPKQIEYIRVKDGRNSGQMVLTFQSQPRVKLYEYRYSTDMDEKGEIIWGVETHSTTSSRNNLVAPVVPGQVYFLSARAINTRGAGDWCEPVSWMVR